MTAASNAPALHLRRRRPRGGRLCEKEIRIVCSAGRKCYQITDATETVEFQELLLLRIFDIVQETMIIPDEFQKRIFKAPTELHTAKKLSNSKQQIRNTHHGIFCLLLCTLGISTT
uniref:Uncharacterized protein n=1 Tax=Oryza meridionalis TaxID=40149 RepID=A0A0E0CIR5_9ORYZ